MSTKQNRTRAYLRNKNFKLAFKIWLIFTHALVKNLKPLKMYLKNRLNRNYSVFKKNKE